METWSTHQLYNEAALQGKSAFAEDLVKNATILRNKSLPVIFSLNHLARIIGIDYLFLHTTVNRRREGANYKLFSIGKRNSQYRRFIHAPCPKIKATQQFINEYILMKVEPHPSSFAFYKGKGVIDCAQQHLGALWIFKFDLKDFFSTINEPQVYQVFKNLGYRPLLAFELSRICTTTHLPMTQKGYTNSPYWFDEYEHGRGLPYKNHDKKGVLPQGAPTSPMLSNIVANKLDESLNLFAGQNGFTYTRYADDLTFSLASNPEGMDVNKVIQDVYSIIYKNNFLPNKSKTKVLRPGSRKVVLGLLIDGERVRLIKTMRNRIDRNLYSVKKFGIEKASEYYKFDSAFGFANHVNGLLAYAKGADYKYWQSCNKKYQTEITGLSLFGAM